MPPRTLSRPNAPKRGAHAAAAVASVCVLLALGCRQPPKADGPIELPGIGPDAGQPRGVIGVIRRVDVPADEPTDEAWRLVDERVVPPLLRGCWQGNGLRIGLLRREMLNAYSEAMPGPLAFGQSGMTKSGYDVPILESPRLRQGVAFTMDLTRPPRPRATYDLIGGQSSTLRLLARIEADEAGRHLIVLTPHHFIPSPFDLVPRSPLEKELDGRVLDELTLRLPLNEDQIAVVGLYDLRTAPTGPLGGENNNAGPGAGDGPEAETDSDKQARLPELPRTFGSTLFSGTRVRQPSKTVLLITIETPQAEKAEEDGGR